MANSFKNYFLKNANTTSQNVYVAGAGVSATVIGMTIGNTTAAPISANITVTSATVAYTMLLNATIATGGALVPVGGDQKLVLEAGDYIQVQT
jgi:phosphoribosylcarboxyaminoimidazole (NCAIR) mutase